MSVTVRVMNLNQVMKDLDLKLQDVQTDVKKEIATAANDIRNIATDFVPVNTGHLRLSLKVEYGANRMSAAIGSNEKYAAVVEKGRRPGPMPFEPIYYWVKRMGIAGSFSIKTKKASKSKKSEEQVKSVAFAIWKSLMKKGFRAKPYLGKAYDIVLPHFMTRLQQLKYKR